MHHVKALALPRHVYVHLSDPLDGTFLALSWFGAMSLFLSGYILLCQHDHNAGDHDAYDAGKADQIRCDIPEHPAENPHR